LAKNEPRVRPSARPRVRYLLFAVEPVAGAPSRADLIQRIRGRAPAKFDAWLTRYEHGLGILRVARGEEREARDFLSTFEVGAGVRLVPKSTSGTIAGLERRLDHGKLGRGERKGH